MDPGATGPVFNDLRLLAPRVSFIGGEGREAGDAGSIRKVVQTRSARAGSRQVASAAGLVGPNPRFSGSQFLRDRLDWAVIAIRRAQDYINNGTAPC